MANSTTSHYFHAEAHALAGKLRLPFEEQIKKQAFVKLEGKLADLTADEREPRNYFSQHAKDFRLEGIFSYAAAHTQVSGHASEKHEGASVTLATSVVEDLNVLNVVTADRVVAQISTTHIPGEYTPQVTFLGTHFENLRIARHPARPYLKLDFAGARSEGERALPFDPETHLMKSIANQYSNLKTKIRAWVNIESLPEAEREERWLALADAWLGKKYYRCDLNPVDIQKLASAQREKDEKANGAKPGNTQPKAVEQNNDDPWDGIACSLVENVEIEDIPGKNADGKSDPIKPPAVSFGHVIQIPDFGKVFLAEVTVKHNSYTLTMIRFELGCLASGDAGVGVCTVNGGGGKGGGTGGP